MNNLIVFGNAEKEYWRRELGATVFPKTSGYLVQIQSYIEQGIRPIVQVGSGKEELEELTIFPRNSIIASLYADETYSPKSNQDLLNADSIFLVIRSYSLPKYSLIKVMKSFVQGLLDLSSNLSFPNSLKFFNLCSAGLVMALRQKKIGKLEKKLEKNSIAIPFGYTDLFCQSFISFLTDNFGIELKPEVSLLSSEVSEILSKGEANRKFRFGFIGQRGNLARNFAINSVRTKNSILVERDHYGGTLGGNEATRATGIEYIEVLTKSTSFLCPPGNYSGHSFRILESLICGALPIVSSNVITDPLFQDPTGLNGNSHVIYSWKKRIREHELLNSSQINDLLQEARIKHAEQIQSSKLHLQKFQFFSL
jgi:hypothetical protein